MTTESNLKITDIFNAMSANETIAEAKQIKTPIQLWKEFWIENEVCCLFADANVGKSILAVQIANHIANMLEGDEKVLYYDFELSKKQFEMRYTDPENGESFNFSDKFIRLEIDSDNLNNVCQQYHKSLDSVMMEAIESNINLYHSKAIIIDNISWLVNMKTTGGTAAKLMTSLIALKRKYGLSILVLAHTPKRNLGTVLTQNSLSGSKSFGNFFDSMFAIGKSVTDDNVKYIKQIKVRTGEFEYDTNNVLTATIEKGGAFLGFKLGDCVSERSLLSSGTTSHCSEENLSGGKRMTKNRKRKAIKRRAKSEFIDCLAKLAFEKIFKPNNL